MQKAFYLDVSALVVATQFFDFFFSNVILAYYNSIISLIETQSKSIAIASSILNTTKEKITISIEFIFYNSINAIRNQLFIIAKFYLLL